MVTMAEFRLPKPEDLHELRRKVGLTQSELAKRVGVSQSVIARIERGQVSPSMSTLRKILDVIEDERQEHLRIHDLVQWKRRTSKLPSLIFVEPSDKVRRAVLLMKRHGISQIPVISNKFPVGSVHERTIIRQLMSFGSKAVFSKSVQEIMETPFPTIDVNDNIETAFNQIAEGVDAILVLDDSTPIGVITKIDLIMFMK